MSDESGVTAMLDVISVTAHSLRATGKHAKAELLYATEALLRTYFAGDKPPLEPEAARILRLRDSAPLQ